MMKTIVQLTFAAIIPVLVILPAKANDLEPSLARKDPREDEDEEEERRGGEKDQLGADRPVPPKFHNVDVRDQVRDRDARRPASR